VLARESLVHIGPDMLTTFILALMALKKAETTSNVLVLTAMHAFKVSVSPLGTASLGTASLGTASLGTASLGTASLGTASLGTASLGTAS
jgi:hypothetical protein